MRDKNSGSTPPAELPAEQKVLTDGQFRLMVQQIKDYAVFMLDPKGYILSWNDGAQRIKGYSASEIIGKHFSIFYPREEAKAGKPDRELEMARSAGSLELEGWRLRKDGSRFWAGITITPLFDALGELIGFNKITRDFTERRQMEDALQKSRNMFERLFETSPDAIVVVDGNGTIRKLNQQAEVLFGYMREELIGARVERLVPEQYQRSHRQYRRSYFQDPRPRKMGAGLELYGLTQDGRSIPVDIMLTPIDTSEGTWAFAVVRDITRQRQSDAKIMELNAALKSQIEQLEASNRELEAFSYSVSHDLRAPLRHVIGFVDLLNSRNPEGLDDKSRHYLQVITEAARKMGNLIDDLLSFSRMGRTEMMKSRLDFGQLVRDIARELAAEARERTIEWKIRPLPEVMGDAAMLRQVVYNLLANAVKFTRDKERATIEVGAVEQEREIRFFVRDNGVGFDSAYVNKLFGLFQRLHRAEEFEGTGVGLAIVQRIIARHGGRAWAEGSLGQGATFWFSLPKNSGEHS
ncbi:MAG TPA: PAS domain S-box protein [Geomonas sp.]|nr:PAS domain S-box protein [Geomonas sp.]